MKSRLSLAAASACLPLLAFAQTERDLDSHVHGSATLNVVIAETAVYIELNSPWDNIVGFEHAPQTQEQKALVNSAMVILKNPDQLMVFDGGDCSFEEALVENSMGGDEHEDEDEHDDEHEHDEEQHEQAHATMLVNYTFACTKINTLNSIELSLFSVWPGFEELDVQLVSDKGQMLVELDALNTVLDLEQVR